MESDNDNQLNTFDGMNDNRKKKNSLQRNEKQSSNNADDNGDNGSDEITAEPFESIVVRTQNESTIIAESLPQSAVSLTSIEVIYKSLIYELFIYFQSTDDDFPLKELPDHILLNIFGNFRPNVICKQFSRISHRFNRLSYSNSLWNTIDFEINGNAVIDRNRSFGNILVKVC